MVNDHSPCYDHHRSVSAKTRPAVNSYCLTLARSCNNVVSRAGTQGSHGSPSGISVTHNSLEFRLYGQQIAIVTESLFYSWPSHEWKFVALISREATPELTSEIDTRFIWINCLRYDCQDFRTLDWFPLPYLFYWISFSIKLPASPCSQALIPCHLFASSTFAGQFDARSSGHLPLEVASGHRLEDQNDALQPEKFTFDTFLVFYKHLVCREEINAIYEAASYLEAPIHSKRWSGEVSLVLQMVHCGKVIRTTVRVVDDFCAWLQEPELTKYIIGSVLEDPEWAGASVLGL
ncbi:hypothetical protein LAZ67_22001418 [Cordylochernes scorpioides]|uniref:Uncharacterized protein n=1 Tax=Cordylochernes scorpioides TaxID=51811 RepID=A0ABY6LNY2_9ARAC|nr:hypothetical protein LAZ67_22001418 [Cordylochernes scorpioides]